MDITNKLAVGSVNKLDENLNRYRMSVQSKKWYWPILTWLVDVSINNAWQIRRSSGNNQTQLEFKRELATYYIKKYGVAGKGPGRPLSSKRSPSCNRVSDDIRYDRIDHLVITVPDKKKKSCVGEGCLSIVRTMCKKCNLGSCIPCFSIFLSITY